MLGRITRAGILACALAIPVFEPASAGTAYDGSWNLSIVTERGIARAPYGESLRKLGSM